MKKVITAGLVAAALALAPVAQASANWIDDDAVGAGTQQQQGTP
jgi:hypothetical protein